MNAELLMKVIKAIAGALACIGVEVGEAEVNVLVQAFLIVYTIVSAVQAFIIKKKAAEPA